MTNEKLRPMVERLIIENRNSLNDPTANEPYDVNGIADDFIELLQSHTNQAISDVLNFETHTKNARVQKLDENHISITSSGISFGKSKPVYERAVIEFDSKLKAIRFHEAGVGEYGISYKVGVNPANGVYGFRARPFIGVLPTGYYKKISEHTYQLSSKNETN